MSKVAIINTEGATVSHITIPDVKPAHTDTIAQVIAHLSHNSRQAIAHTKNRGDVSGGGIKPWRQKGTGRSRHGSIRSPLWRGGGITFGPRSDRNYSTRLPKKMYQKALQSLLAARIADNSVKIISDLTLPTPKTKIASALLDTLGLTSDVLIVTEQLDKELTRAFRNLPDVEIMPLSATSVLDIARHSMVLLTKAAAVQLFVSETSETEAEPKKQKS